MLVAGARVRERCHVIRPPASTHHNVESLMPKGHQHSPEVRQRMRTSHLGVPLSKTHAENIGKANTVPLSHRFWDKVQIGTVDECWEWMAAKDPRGYGRIGGDDRRPSGRKRTELAHRVAYKMKVGPVPDGLFVCHHCDNSGCCNPKHLFLGTCKDNNQDMYRKGRDANQHTGRTHCQRGHEFDTNNTYITARGHRACKACSAMHHRGYTLEKKRLAALN